MTTYRRRDEDKEEIERRWDVVGLLEELGVQMRPGPANRRNVDILCPFHGDRSPSLGVETERGVWNCRSASCGQYGDFWKLYGQLTGMNFWEAKKTLAAKYGVSLRYGREDREQLSDSERIQRTRQWYVRWCQEQLQKSPQALRYLTDRGLTLESITRYRLGFAPPDAKMPASSSPTATVRWDDLELAGIMYRDDQGKLRRRFINRIIVPITVHGALVDISGRTLGDSDRAAKYMNIGGGEKYPWGLDFLGSDPDMVAIMEGQFDGMLSCQEGVPALALRGTKSGFLHYLNLLPESCVTITALDNDVAGCAHVIEIGKELMGRGLMNYVAVLPEGQDPADVVLEYRDAPGFWRQFIEAAEPLPAWQARTLDPLRLASFKTRAKELEPIVRLLAQVNPIHRQECYRELELVLHDYGIGEEHLDEWRRMLERRQRAR